MKTYLRPIAYFCLLISASLLNGCKPEIKDIGPSYVAGEGIYGTWSMSKIIQTDLKVPLPESKDLSSLLSDPAGKMILRINKDKTYEITQPGYVPRIFGTSGTWSYDVTPFPTKLMFYPTPTDTVTVSLSNMPREIDNNFGFNFDRKNPCGEKYVNYAYTFSRN